MNKETGAQKKRKKQNGFTILEMMIVMLVVAVLLTMAAFFAFAQTQSIKITWYLIVAALVLGFMVAYSAMFGYDKLQEILHYNTRTGEGDSDA